MSQAEPSCLTTSLTTSLMENARKAELLGRAKAKKRAKEEADRAAASGAAPATSAARSSPLRRAAATQPDVTRLERELTEKCAEAARVGAPPIRPRPLFRRALRPHLTHVAALRSGGRRPRLCVKRRMHWATR